VFDSIILELYTGIAAQYQVVVVVVVVDSAYPVVPAVAFEVEIGCSPAYLSS
jgi:hypothetical protein